MRFDTHVHLCDKQFDKDRAQCIAQADKVLECAVSLENAGQVLRLAAQYKSVYAAVGIHPSYCPPGEHITAELDRLAVLVQHPCCTAIGEIGLDKRADQPEFSLQQRLFAEQLDIAAMYRKPVSIHCVRASGPLCDILRSRECGRGFIHGFSMSKETARLCMDKGYLLGVGTVAAYTNGDRLRDVLRYIPKDRVVLETDSPYMPPEPQRGMRNVPDNLKIPAQVLAELWNCEIQQVYAVTYTNACTALGIV